MRRSLLKVLLFCSVSVLTLAGCGGGGGGGGKPHIDDKVPDLEKFAKWSDAPKPGVLYVDGTAQNGSYKDVAGNAGTVKDEGIHGSETIIVYDKVGKIVKLTLKTHDTKVVWDSSVDTFETEGTMIHFYSPSKSSQDDIALMADPGLNHFEYQSYGAWMTGRTKNDGTFGGFSMGKITQGKDIPKVGSVTFNGTAGGVYFGGGIDSGEKYTITSKMKMVANFDARTLGFSTTDSMQHFASGGSAPLPSLNMNGTLTYNPGVNKFTGTVTTTGLTGNSTGYFYGPKAAEVGGVFYLSNPNGTTETYSGAYGGTK